jgi:nitrogen fixation/metabolism regulation signal transduction histidine kinase
VFADPEQLQQVLVNLYKNAQEANLANPENQAKSCINIAWQTKNNQTLIVIEDMGKGINNSDNLFVPYYTTKKKGSGIGLTLSRQIMLNHNGDLQVENIERQGANSGACAIITLPAGYKN